MHAYVSSLKLHEYTKISEFWSNAVGDRGNDDEIYELINLIYSHKQYTWYCPAFTCNSDYNLQAWRME